MSPLRSFDHVGITVADLDAVAEFFVGLGFEISPRDAPLRISIEEREACAFEERMYKRGDEHGFSRSREPGHAKPDGWAATSTTDSSRPSTS